METMFYHPRSLQEAAALLDELDDAVIVNGGSDIILEISAQKIQPAAIVFVRDIEGMDCIYDDGEYVHIGGSVTYRQMLRSPACCGMEGLIAAAGSVGSPAIRAVATPAGNILTAAPSADCATMLLALNAELNLVSAHGERWVPQREVYLGAYQTVIEKNEILRELRFPSMAAGMGTGYCRLSRRKAQDIAKIISGAVVQLDREGRCVKASVSLGAVNATAVLARSVEEGIVGLRSDEAAEYIMRNYPREAGLRESYFKQYKESTVCHVVAQAVSGAYAEAKGRMR